MNVRHIRQSSSLLNSFLHKKPHRRVKASTRNTSSTLLHKIFQGPLATNCNAQEESTYNKSSHLTPSDTLFFFFFNFLNFFLEASKLCSTAIARVGLHNLKPPADYQKHYWFSLSSSSLEEIRQ